MLLLDDRSARFFQLRARGESVVYRAANLERAQLASFNVDLGQCAIKCAPNSLPCSSPSFGKQVFSYADDIFRQNRRRWDDNISKPPRGSSLNLSVGVARLYSSELIGLT